MASIKTLNDLLDEAARAGGSRTAYAFGDETVSFSGLRARSLAAAAGFAKRGVKAGDCVAIIHRNSPDFVVAYFALSRLGAVAVPINFMVQKADELAYMLNDCRAVGVVSQAEFLKGVRPACAKSPSVKRLWLTDGAPEGPAEEAFSALAGSPSEAPAPSVSPEDTAAILYTSGTTGNPKGAMLTHKNFISNCEASVRVMGLTSKDVGLCILPMFHSFAWTGNVLACLRAPCALLVFSSITPAKPWLKAMGWWGVTLFSAVPQVYSVLAKQCCGFQSLFLRYFSFRRVRVAISGAAPLSPAIADAFESAFGVPILEGYGLTETTPVVTINPPVGHKRGSVGRPIDGVRVRIAGDDGKELPLGEEGEICVQGDNVMKGYHNLPDATRAAYTADGWLKTGDIGALDADGFLYIRDRKKDMIIIKGLKVFSAQVEAVLLEHPAIAEAAIIGVPDEHGDETIKAFLVLKPGEKADKAALTKFCREKFDPYKRPRDIEIVEALPKNALQKVLKRTLRAQELEKRKAQV